MSVLESYSLIIGKRHDIPLSFQLAMEMFIGGNYQVSQTLFHELSERARLNPGRLNPFTENRYLEGGRPKEFIGIIVDTPTVGFYGRIQCNEFVGWERGISVRKDHIDFSPGGGKQVYFSIVFNMKGPEASRVRPVY